MAIYRKLKFGKQPLQRHFFVGDTVVSARGRDGWVIKPALVQWKKR